MLRLSSIRKSYCLGSMEIEVLKGVDLDVVDGDFLSLTGSSGSGKTTLMNIIGLLDKPTTGDYVIGGEKITYENDDTLSELRNRKIGFVFQHYNLLPRLTVLENIGVPLRYRGVVQEEMQCRAWELLKKMGLEEIAYRRPPELSGGQQQRVSLARALVGAPDILLADEPTGALDTLTENLVLDLFSTLHDEGLTIVLITHSPAVAERSKRRMVLRDGVITEL
jgi:putative ABC transport system ATP-binding protein